MEHPLSVDLDTGSQALGPGMLLLETPKRLIKPILKPSLRQRKRLPII